MSESLEDAEATGGFSRTPAQSLFREQAVAYHSSEDGEQDAQLLRVSPPWTWSLFTLLSLLVTAAVVLACFVDVDITSKGPGALRAGGGVRVLKAQVAGVVAEVHARSGQVVSSGEALVQLESATTEAALLEAERRLVHAREQLSRFSARQEALYAERATLLGDRLKLLHSRRKSLDGTIERLKKRAKSYARLNHKGIVGALTSDDATEEHAQAERQRMSLLEEQSQTSVQITALESERVAERWRHEREVEEAETKRSALAFVLQQTIITAPAAGFLEAVLVRPGDSVQVSAPLGRLVALGAPSDVVAFVAERDRAFVRTGEDARIEVEQLPYGEFGTLHARVSRVASDLAVLAEYADVLGESPERYEPMYRVELALVNDARVQQLAEHLRPGMLVRVRFKLRERRLIALVIDPLRRWFR